MWTVASWWLSSGSGEALLRLTLMMSSPMMSHLGNKTANLPKCKNLEMWDANPVLWLFVYQQNIPTKADESNLKEEKLLVAFGLRESSPWDGVAVGVLSS